MAPTILLPDHIHLNMDKEPKVVECEIDSPAASSYPPTPSELLPPSNTTSQTHGGSRQLHPTSPAVPRPIMARLPSDELDQDDIYNPDGYLTPVPLAKVPGTLPFNPSWSGLTYTNAHLPSLNEFGRAAWAALHDFRPHSAEYATNLSLRLRDASTDSSKSQKSGDLVRQVFDWAALRMPPNLSGTLHGVVFSSKRAPSCAATSLYDADRASHEEAVGAGGLLMYWYGVPNAEGENLATCIWTDQLSAKQASALPKHREAVKHARHAYEWFELARYRVVKDLGEEQLNVTEW